ncbi:hypothetical protein P2318_33695 [Myxococcaceae bacterium GXIMD 01537]
MIRPDDRRDLACLGLMVLVYGLAVAPVVHAVVGHGGGHRTHAAHVHAHDGADGRHVARGEDPAHAHGAGDDGHGTGPGEHEHAPGSVEHLWALAVEQVAVLAPHVVWVTLGEAKQLAPTRLPGARWRLPAMPQGP